MIIKEVVVEVTAVFKGRVDSDLSRTSLWGLAMRAVKRRRMPSNSLAESRNARF